MARVLRDDCSAILLSDARRSVPELLSGAAARGERLHAANLARLRAPDQCFDGANWPLAYMPRAQLPQATFRCGELLGLIAPDTEGEGADFTDCDLTDADLRGGRWRGARFVRARLHRASFDHADLTDCDFTDAEAPGIRLVGALAHGATFDRAWMPDADFSEACFREARLHGAILDGARGQSCDFAHADLWRARLIMADLKFSTFRQACLARLAAQGADLRFCDFEGAATAGIDVRYADLRDSAGLDHGGARPGSRRGAIGVSRLPSGRVQALPHDEIALQAQDHGATHAEEQHGLDR